MMSSEKKPNEVIYSKYTVQYMKAFIVKKFIQKF